MQITSTFTTPYHIFIKKQSVCSLESHVVKKLKLVRGSNRNITYNHFFTITTLFQELFQDKLTTYHNLPL